MKITPLSARLFNQPVAILESARTEILAAGGAYNMPGKPADPTAGFEADDESGGLSPICYVPVFGVIGYRLGEDEEECGWCDILKVSAMLRACLNDPYCERVILHCSGPGGLIIGGPELWEQIQELDAVKPVVSFVDDIACSQTFFIASAARMVCVTPSARVGNVGTRMDLLDISKMLTANGIAVNVYKSGEFKDLGSSSRPQTEVEKQMIQAEVDKHGARFRSYLTSKRAIAAADLEGQIFEGSEAVVKGLADYTCDSLEECMAMAAHL